MGDKHTETFTSRRPTLETNYYRISSVLRIYSVPSDTYHSYVDCRLTLAHRAKELYRTDDIMQNKTVAFERIQILIPRTSAAVLHDAFT